jgi:tRNA(Ile)-lysidine synthase
MSQASVELLAARNAVRRCIDPGPIIVGCSGGPDSLALVAAAVWTARHTGAPLTIGVVDHGLQAGSASIAVEAAQACHALGAEDVEIQTVDVGGAGGPESAARDARRAALLDLAHRRGSEQILLAHTREDQAETVLLRLSRGAGARSLAAMRACAPPWYRPFLDLPRADVHAVAAEVCGPLGIRPWTDPHNSDPRFARVRVRRLLNELTAELGPGVVHGLSRSAALLADDADVLDAWAEQETARIVDDDGITVSAELAALAELPRSIRTRVLRTMHQRASGEGELAFDHVRALEAYVSNRHGQGPCDLPSGVTARADYGRLTFLHTATPQE